MRRHVIPLLLFGLASPALAQIGLSPVGDVVGHAMERLGRAVGDIAPLDPPDLLHFATQLAQDRVNRLTTFIRENRTMVERDDLGQPARRGVVLILDSDPTTLDTARRLGFTVSGADAFGNLGLSATQLSVPDGMALPRALAVLRKALPEKTVTADPLHFTNGAVRSPRTGGRSPPASQPINTRVGIIDGGIAPSLKPLAVRGFATGAPAPSDHGTAVASLLRRAGVTNILSADVYGRGPAGGNALAIVRAMDWMAGEKVPVISISLVGPRNPLMERAITAIAKRGVIITAAVGNDGPAAPPAFPASYSPVIAVTGVDGRNRALIEAGRALHLDYAAPGADMKALDGKGVEHSVRGTSFAAPLVAARAAAALDRGEGSESVRAVLNSEARDLGRKGPDQVYGRGLLCGACRSP